MKTKEIKVKADVGDTVMVGQLELRATVLSICIDPGHVTYQVSYFHNGERKTAWLYPTEFELRPA